MSVRRIIALTLIAIVLGACAGDQGPVGSISGRLVAGPTCPVETDPPDPACAAASVAGAVVTASTSDGETFTVESDAEGRFTLDVPVGEVTLHFAEVETLMGTPEEVTVDLSEGEDLDVGDIVYDTGIR